MKGEAVLDLAVSGSGWSVRKLHAEYADDRSSPYAALGAKYRSARVTCTPSRDLPERSREQFAPAVNVESLMCGTPVVTTDQPAIEEWLEGCPAVRWARQDHTDSLRAALSDAFLIDDDERASGAAWAREGFSNEAVARRWLRILWEAAS